MMHTKYLIALAVVLISPALAAAEPPQPQEIHFFETHIRPALTKYCYECHSVESGDSRGGLLLDTRQG
ncbi:MAG: hypothetical protein AAFP90_21215, partial [Planctomycetota bacterium]